MFSKHTLQNGLRIVTVSIKNTKTVTVLVVVETGSRYEGKKTNGISHFLEHMFFKGTKKRPTTLDLALEIDQIGGEHNAFTSKEFTGYYAKAAAKYEELLLDLISDMYLNSKLAQEEIERERGVICEEINLRQDTPLVYVADLFEKLLYGDEPAGWLTIGTKENVQSWQREDLVNYLKKNYVAGNTIVLVAGNVESKMSFPKIRKYFSAAPQGKSPSKKKALKVQDKPHLLLHSKDTDQNHFCLGVRAYSARHPDYWTLQVLSAVLGGGMSSRLFISVRERKGLAYYIKTDSENYTDTGYLVTQAGVGHNKLAEAIRIILEEYKRVRSAGVSQKELKKAKEYIKGQLILNLETSDEIAFHLASQEVVRGEILVLQKVLKKIDEVESQDLQRVAKDIFQNKNLNLAVIGPQKEEDFLKRKLTF